MHPTISARRVGKWVRDRREEGIASRPLACLVGRGAAVNIRAGAASKDPRATAGALSLATDLLENPSPKAKWGKELMGSLSELIAFPPIQVHLKNLLHASFF